MSRKLDIPIDSELAKTIQGKVLQYVAKNGMYPNLILLGDKQAIELGMKGFMRSSEFKLFGIKLLVVEEIDGVYIAHCDEKM